MEQYECIVSGYVYDPEKGDDTRGIEPGTSFEYLPHDRVCPECGVLKENFVPREE